jgi:hypothetical protein
MRMGDPSSRLQRRRDVGFALCRGTSSFVAMTLQAPADIDSPSAARLLPSAALGVSSRRSATAAIGGSGERKRRRRAPFQLVDCLCRQQRVETPKRRQDVRPHGCPRVRAVMLSRSIMLGQVSIFENCASNPRMPPISCATAPRSISSAAGLAIDPSAVTLPGKAHGRARLCKSTSRLTSEVHLMLDTCRTNDIN